MGLKAVEMQVAIPRTQDAGKMQDDAMKQNQQFQDKLTQHQLRQDQLRRTKVNEYDQVKKRDVTEDKSDSSREQDEQNEQKNTSGTQNEQINHPYLGNNIDFSR